MVKTRLLSKPEPAFKGKRIAWIRPVYVLILLVTWSGLVGWLIKTNYLDKTNTIRLVSLETGIRDLPGDTEWMAIYHQGKKLGYSTYTLRNQGAEGYRLRSSTRLKTAIAGFETEIQLVNKVQIDTLFRLQSFDVRLITENFNTRFRGSRSGDTVHVDHFQGRDSSRFAIRIPDEVYTYIGIQPMLANQGFKPGQRLVIPSFDPLSMEVSDLEIVHEGKEIRDIQGIEMNLNKIRISMRGIPSYIWLDDNGLTYREESLLGLVMERVTPDQAVATDSTANGLDLIESFAIPVETEIKNPPALKALTLEISGLDTNTLALINNERQRIIRQDGDLLLQLKPVSVPVTKTVDLNQLLQPTPLIQCTHPRVKNLAATIGQGEEDQGQPVDNLVHWVYSNLKKRPIASLNSTLEILDRKEGDCSEHSALFTALSRSMGIPTKIHAGLVYIQGRFLFHAWPVVAQNGQWLAVDPTLGQEVADATHIALLETDFTNLYQLLPLLGNITIRVVGQQY